METATEGKKKREMIPNISLGILITEMDDWQFIGRDIILLLVTDVPPKK